MSDIAQPATGPKTLGETATMLIQEGPVEALSAPASVFNNEENKLRCINFLKQEIIDVRDGDERSGYLEQVRKWRRQRIARPENKTKDYPFPQSANVCPPLVAEKGNVIYAKMLSNYSTKRPFFSGTSPDPLFKNHAEAFARYLSALAASPFHLNLKPTNRKMFYDLVFLGTQFYELSWQVDRRMYMQNSPTEGSTAQAYQLLHNGPGVRPIPVEDFFTRTYWDDLQRAPWIAYKFDLSYAELKQRELDGRYLDVALMLEQYKSKLTDMEEAQAEAAGTAPKLDPTVDTNRVYELYAFHVYWDINEDGKLIDLKGVIEPETGTLLRIEFNPIGYRLIGRIPYFEIPGQLYGIGIGQMLELLQDEAEMLHNHRLDNLKWAMLNLFVARKGSSIKPNEAIFPGKIFFEDQPGDFRVLSFPDLSPSTHAAESLARDYAERYSGANSAMGGFADQTLKSGGGSQAQQFMAAQGATILDAQLDTVDEHYAEMAQMLILLLAANKELVDLTLVAEADRPFITEVLSMPITDLLLKFKFNIETTDIARSEEAKKANYAGFTQLYAQYTQGIIQDQIMQAQAPNMAPFLAKFTLGKTRLMEQLLDFFDIAKPEDFLPDLNMLKAQADQLAGGMNAGQGAALGPTTGGAGVPPVGGGGIPGAVGGPAAGPQMAPGPMV